MLDFLWHSAAAQLGLAGLVVAGALAVAWFVPPFRRLALMIAGIAFSAATIYAKGAKDRANLENRRKEEAVRRAQEGFSKIDARPDTPDDAARRLRDGSF